MNANTLRTTFCDRVEMSQITVCSSILLCDRESLVSKHFFTARFSALDE